MSIFNPFFLKFQNKQLDNHRCTQVKIETTKLAFTGHLKSGYPSREIKSVHFGIKHDAKEISQNYTVGVNIFT